MRERPILFSGEMVRAILAGKKTQTRRLCAVQPVEIDGAWHVLYPWGDGAHGIYETKAEMLTEYKRLTRARCPFGTVGDRLWVREGIRLKSRWHDGARDVADSVYIADEMYTRADAWPWKNSALPGIHCPRGLSRITLEVTGVGVERLQEIDEYDAVAEGVRVPRCDCEVCMRSATMCPADASAHILVFSELWDWLNRKRAPWASNPWVWVVEFKRAKE